jgi:hypothetical protein
MNLGLRYLLVQSSFKKLLVFYITESVIIVFTKAMRSSLARVRLV